MLKKWGAITVMILGAGLILFFFINEFPSPADKEKSGLPLEEKLKKFIIPPLDGDGLSGGDEKNRLIAYSILTRLDPIFGLEGANIDYLEIAIKQLETSVDDLIKTRHWKDETPGLINLHPIGFLKTLPALERKRRKVTANPDKKLIDEYNKELSATITLYKHSLENLTEQFNDLRYYDRRGRKTGEIKNEEFVFVDSSTDLNILVEALKNLLSAADQQEQKLKDRTNCLENSDYCAGLLSFENLRFPEKEVSSGPGLIKIFSGLYRPLNLPARSLVDRFLAENTGHVKEGGRLFEIATPCFNQGNPSHFYIAWRQKQDISRHAHREWKNQKLENVFQPLLLDELYFYKINESLNYYRPLIEAGFDFYYQPETNPYMCPDAGYQAELLALSNIMKEMESAPPPVPLRPSLKILKAYLAQKILIRSGLADIKGTSYYLDLWGDLINELGEKKLAETVGAEEVLKIESLIIQLKQKSGGFPDLLTSGVYFNKNLKSMLPRLENHTLPINLLFVGRSLASIYFLPFNNSVAGPYRPTFAASPAQESDNRELEDTPIIKLDELRAAYSDDKILELIKISRRLSFL